MFIDTHSHLYLGELQNHIPEAVEHLRENNFSHSIQIGTSIETSRTCINLAKQYDIIRATIGIHPCEAQDMPVEEIPEQMHILEKLIQEEKTHIVGLGEIGFDHYHLSSDTSEAIRQKGRQIEWFRAQVELAKKYSLPVVIHTRNCSPLTLQELTLSRLETFVIHCFSEDWSFATKVFDMGDKTKISFTGILTYPKSVTIQEVAKKSPLEKLMIETDAPYLIPEGLRGTIPYCEPVHSLYVFRKLCEIRREKAELLEQKLWDSSCDFFNL
ncbi:TatD family hydrolase [Candidatus Gracilibacteria bacterium]|nr:TatD family hydrolase [Candidatus Gracilibacteria bacterium]